MTRRTGALVAAGATFVFLLAGITSGAAFPWTDAASGPVPNSGVLPTAGDDARSAASSGLASAGTVHEGTSLQDQAGSRQGDASRSGSLRSSRYDDDEDGGHEVEREDREVKR
jgi:hypothetical protein